MTAAIIEKKPLCADQRFNLLVIAVLLGFGIYQSILYFGHKPVPNTDFPGFLHQGRVLVSLKLPTHFKIPPGLGILQVGMSKLISGPHPHLTAGWLLNAVLHPLTLILLWLVGRRIVGNGTAVWIAILAIINAQVIELMGEPIVETLFLFCILLTFYFIFRPSYWSYLLAALTTMVRYDGATLILIALVMDLIRRKEKKERVRALIYAALAGLPLALWMLGTLINWQAQGGTHYLQELGAASGGRVVVLEFLEVLWKVGFSPLLLWMPKASPAALEALSVCSRVAAAAGFLFGVGYGLYHRRWKVAALVFFCFMYIMVHAIHSFLYFRFCVPVSWILLFVCWYGFQSFWKLLNEKMKIPNGAVVAAQALVLLVSAVWFTTLLKKLPVLAHVSTRSVSLPYVTIGVIAILFLGRSVIYRFGHFRTDLVAVGLVCLMATSNQFNLARIVGNGDRDNEFKELADWYVSTVAPGGKIICSKSNIMWVFHPEMKNNFVNFWNITAATPAEFQRKCREKGVTIVAWDSWLGTREESRYYKLWHLDNIAALSLPRSIGPYEFVKRFENKHYKDRFINVFRLKP